MSLIEWHRPPGEDVSRRRRLLELPVNSKDNGQRKVVVLVVVDEDVGGRVLVAVDEDVWGRVLVAGDVSSSLFDEKAKSGRLVAGTGRMTTSRRLRRLYYM